jgi:alpha-1,2-mannosyltransferase
MLTRFRSRPLTQRVLVVACVVIVATHWVVIAHRRQTQIGDFDISREFGRRLLAGEYLYAGGLHYPYMPTAALYFAPLALCTPSVGIALRYGIALGCLWLTLRLLYALLRAHKAELSAQRFAISAIALILASPYIIRDLDDGGPHLILLAMIVGGISCVWKGRILFGAVCFGLATALKATSALFVPFFIWKRQWRLAAYTAAATLGWMLLPMAWMGASSWWSHQREWTGVVLGSLTGHRTAVAEASEARVQNQALKPAVIRYLATVGAQPPLRATQSGEVATPTLAPGTANRLATAALLSLLAVCGWWGRKRYQGRHDPAWLLECSAVLILVLLSSPVTWGQHMVLMLPALYLIVAEGRTTRRLGVPAVAAMWLYIVLALLLNREVLGRGRYLVLLSYNVRTLCMLLVLGVLIFRRPTARQDP